MVDITNKEARQATKEVRQDLRESKQTQRQSDRWNKRNAKALGDIEQAASDRGIDFDNLVKKPITDPVKSHVTEGIKKATDKRLWDQVEGFSEAYTKPEYKDVPGFDQIQMAKDLKKQRRNRFIDALYAVGEGFQGRTAQPQNMISQRAQMKRDAQFQSYKDATMTNRLRKEEWEHQYRNDLIDFLKNKRDQMQEDTKERNSYDRAIRELEQKQSQFEKEYGLEKDKLAEDIAARKERGKLGRDELAEQRAEREGKEALTREEIEAGKYGKRQPQQRYTEQIDENSWQLTNQGDPYKDLMYKLSGDSPEIMNEFAKMAGYPVSETGDLAKPLGENDKEDISNAIVSRMFDIQTDPQTGQRIAKVKPGMEDYFNSMARNISNIKQAKSEIDRLNAERRMAVNDANMFTRRSVKEEYDNKINQQSQIVSDSQQALRQSMQGSQNTQTPQVEPELQQKLNEW